MCVCTMLNTLTYAYLEVLTLQIKSFSFFKQIGLQSAKFLLTSTASLEYDRNQYIFFSTVSNNNPPVRKVITRCFHLFCVLKELDIWSICCHFTSQIETVVEVYPEPDFTKEIIGGALGGLALLALLTAGLYKVRHYFSVSWGGSEAIFEGWY